MQLNDILKITAGLIIVLSIVKAASNTVKTAKYNRQASPENRKTVPKYTLVTTVLGLILLVVANSFQVIPTGYTGVRTTFGLIDQESCPSGMNLTIPFVQEISLVNNKQQDIRFDNQIWSETKEQTPVYMEGVNVTYQIVPTASAWIYANVENWVEELVDFDLTSSALKAASRKLEADIVTDRGEIEPDSRQALQAAIDEKYGENKVIIKNVIINNMDFDESYNAAIAKKSEAMQKQQEQAITNQTNIDMAAAEAAAEEARAQGDANAELIRANAKAEANRIIAASITSATQRQDAIEKWDGTLPQATGSNVSFGILDVAAGTAAANTD